MNPHSRIGALGEVALPVRPPRLSAVLAGLGLGLGLASAMGQSPVPAEKPKAPAASEVPVINAWLREQSPAWADWDFGAQLRARYERKDDGGSDGRYAADDFLKETPPGRFNDNAFLLLREKLHVGYTPVPWCTVFLEGRDSSSSGDRRDPNPGADVLDVHQAYLRLGQRGEFPLFATVGRQELLYADERMVGIGDWGNLGRVFDAAKLRWEGAS